MPLKRKQSDVQAVGDAMRRYAPGLDEHRLRGAASAAVRKLAGRYWKSKRGWEEKVRQATFFWRLQAKNEKALNAVAQADIVRLRVDAVRLRRLLRALDSGFQNGLLERTRTLDAAYNDCSMVERQAIPLLKGEVA